MKWYCWFDIYDLSSRVKSSPYSALMQYNPDTTVYQLISPQCCIYASMNWVIIASGNGLSPVRHQAITWTNAGLLSIGPLGTYLSEFESEFYHFHSRKCNWKCRLPKGRPFCPWGDELRDDVIRSDYELTKHPILHPHWWAMMRLPCVFGGQWPC